MMSVAVGMLTMAQVGHQDEAAATFFAMGVLGFVCCISFVALAVEVFVCYLLYTFQSRLPEKYRQISAGSAWLLLIPIFPIVWNFFVYPKIAASYKAYLDDHGSTDHGDAGQTLGLVYAITAIIAAPVALVVLIIYLVKINGYKKQIDAASSGSAIPPAPPVA